MISPNTEKDNVLRYFNTKEMVVSGGSITDMIFKTVAYLQRMRSSGICKIIVNQQEYNLDSLEDQFDLVMSISVYLETR